MLRFWEALADRMTSEQAGFGAHANFGGDPTNGADPKRIPKPKKTKAAYHTFFFFLATMFEVGVFSCFAGAFS